MLFDVVVVVAIVMVCCLMFSCLCVMWFVCHVLLVRCRVACPLSCCLSVVVLLLLLLLLVVLCHAVDGHI